MPCECFQEIGHTSSTQYNTARQITSCHWHIADHRLTSDFFLESLLSIRRQVVRKQNHVTFSREIGKNNTHTKTRVHASIRQLCLHYEHIQAFKGKLNIILMCSALLEERKHKGCLFFLLSFIPKTVVFCCSATVTGTNSQITVYCATQLTIWGKMFT